MLSRLYVKNVALIAEADIEFDSGLNVLSGETGSGKSVILDSVNFVLGSKADRTMIRYGEQEALVRAEFCVSADSIVIKKLNGYDIESDGTVVITRRLNAEGKSTIKINGNTVTVTMLKNITQHLVDVHGQSEHFFLLDEANQLKVIDSFLGKDADDIKIELSEILKEKNLYKTAIISLGGSEDERERKLDLLNFQINEIAGAEIKVGEIDELTAKQKLVMNVEKILSGLNVVRGILSDDGGCIDGINAAKHTIYQISDFDEAYAQIGARLDSLSAEISDIADTVSDMSEDLTFDADEALRIDERLTLLKTLKRKYGFDETEILDYLDKAREEYDAILNSSETIEKYKRQILICNKKLYDLSLKLTELRKKCAKEFSRKVVSELRSLNIPDACFEVSFNNYNEDTVNFDSNGADSVRFEFSANKGEPLKPMSKVISGGEMSRFMLAIKTCLKELNGISTYIFDEIDAGISGYTAGKVANKFIEIAKNTQILAVSHLPQVCAASDAQFLIFKMEENGKTFTKVEKLSAERKIEEIMRLTGSVSSDTAREHAKELVKQFKK